MKENPFKKFDRPSEYLLPGDKEADFLQNIEARISQKEKVHKTFAIKWLIGIAASILIISVIYFLPSKNSSPVQLAELQFEAYKNYQVEQVRGKENATDLSEAYRAYDDKDFEKAKNIFSGKELTNPLDQLYFAIALQGVKQWQQADTVLNDIEIELPNEHIDGWNWHKAIGLLALGEIDLARQKLMEISEADSPFKQNALSILSEIK